MSAFSVSFMGSDVVASCDASTTILDACISTGAPVPYNCRSGECGECWARLMSGSIEEIPGADPAIFNDVDRQQGDILTCMCFPRSNLELDVPLKSNKNVAAIETINTLVEGITWHGREILEVAVLPPSPISFQPGQYFDWTIRTNGVKRSFSAASAPDSEMLWFHIRLHPDGIASNFVSDVLRVGDFLEITGPFGHFKISDNAHRPAIFVAGGTGFAPIRSILDAAVSRKDTRPVRLFYGARTSDSLYCTDDADRWRSTLPDFKFFPALSDEPIETGVDAFRGNVTDLLDSELGSEVFGAEAYLCGPPPMIDAAIDVLLTKGIEKEDIFYDKFLPAKR